MKRTESPLFPISADEIKPYREEVTTYLKQVGWKPDKRKADSGQIDLTFLLDNKALGIQDEDTLSLLKNAVRISGDRIILSNGVNRTLNAIRDGICMGRHLASLYEKASGLEGLVQRNKQGNLHQSEQPEFHDKRETQSAILLFVASYYIVWKLSAFHHEEVSSINIEFGGIPEIVLTRPSRALQGMVYYFTAYVERSGLVNTELELVKMSLLYFERMIQEVLLRKDSLKFANFFTAQHYKYEDTDFVVQGFEFVLHASVSSISFNRIGMEEIVANREAKHMFRRFAERLLCHDIKEGRNPMLELGGLPSITMADGKPGTGKSMLIAATATILHDRCEQLGIPFLFWPLPENIISTYQGGSAERAMDWFRPMADPGKIIFAPIDDAENNLEERTRQGVSAGVREFIGVFLRNTEGAYAINNGNRLISLFTNIPDQIDKAVLSRIQFRVSIEGAGNATDFMDQDYIWWSRYEKLMPGFVRTIAPRDYEFMAAQKEMGTLSEVYGSEMRITEQGVQDVYEEVEKELDPDHHLFFGEFYERIQKHYSFFSSRDLRNIQKAVDARIIDFDLPEVWFEKPEQFFNKDYKTKLNMLRDLVRENLGNMSFDQIRLREAVNYIDTAVRINSSGVEREIEETARRMHIQQEASKRLGERG